MRSLKNNNELPVISGKDEQSAWYGEKYDWDEQSRVLKVVQKLTDDIEDDWPVLAEFLDDERYCLTLHSEYSVHSVFNCSIGSICEQILVESLTAAYMKDIPGGERPWRQLRHPAPLPRDADKLKSWYRDKRRKGKQFYELQIEMCEWAIATIPSVKADREAEKQASIRRIKSRIEELGRKKKPVALKSILKAEFNYPYNWRR